MLMNIWVRDKLTGHVHQIGTDVHDSLMVMDGKIVYYNLQNGEGSGTDGSYEIIDPPDADDYISVTPDELYINKQLVQKDLMEMLTNERQIN